MFAYLSYDRGSCYNILTEFLYVGWGIRSLQSSLSFRTLGWGVSKQLTWVRPLLEGTTSL